MAERQSLEPFANLVSLFFTRAAERGEAPFLWAKKAAGNGDEWQALSWREAAEQVAALAAGLERLGLARGDRVMLVSENRPEWCIADLAIMAAGCITVPAYTTNTERDHQHVLDDSGAAAAIVSTQKLADALLPAAVRAACRHVVAIEPVRAPQGEMVQIHRWDDLVAAKADVAARAAAAAGLTRDDVACLIYTSGTGGAPRGVMQHHGAILHNVEGTFAIIAEDFGIDDEIVLSFLPLSHAYEHSAGQFLPIGLGAQIYYAEGIEKLASNIEEVRPTVMISVPRLFEVLRQRILTGLAKQGRAAQWLTRQALALGARAHAGKPRLGDRAIDLLLERSLRPKVRARFGGRVKAMVSGGAPLNPEIGIFFDSLGIVLLQGYGQTEAGPIISANRPKAGIRMDTVGPPIANTELRIAEDGEIMVRGELVMKGYWRNPDLTAATVRDGWLATGDIGHLDEAGRLVITDRKKDLIVLDKGDNVAPQRVEAMLTLQPEIAQAMVAGDRKPHLVGLIVPDAEWTAAWAKAHGKPRAPNPQAGTLHDNPDYLRALSAAVDRVNDGLSVTEKVRRFILADAPFTIDNQQMTSSLKIRRHVIKQVYGERLEALYRR